MQAPNMLEAIPQVHVYQVPSFEGLFQYLQTIINTHSLTIMHSKECRLKKKKEKDLIAMNRERKRQLLS